MKGGDSVPNKNNCVCGTPYSPYNPYYASTPPPWWQGPWTGSDLYDVDQNLVLDDTEVADLVRDNIEMDPYILGRDKNNISIDVKNGVVTLSGEVRDKRTKFLSYADAFWCDGVVDVVSNLTTRKSSKQKRK